MERNPLRSPARLALAVAAVAALAPTAHAAGPLALCEDGQAFLWPGGGAGVPFNPDQGPLGPLTNAQAVAAVQASFDVWAAVPTATVSYVNAGPLPVDVNIGNFLPFVFPAAPDGLSAIVFDDTGDVFDFLFGPGSGVLGFAGPEWGDPVACTILEGVSFLNGPAFDDLVAATDVMVHEFGHYTNLAHTVVNGQIYIGDDTGPSPSNPFVAPPNPLGLEVVETMYPFYFGPGIGTQTLHRDDVASVSALYPDPSFAATTGTIAGTVLASNGTTRLTGVNVIARNEADPFGDAVSAISSDYSDLSPGSPLLGAYRLFGLTPGADYRVYVDEILAGGFSTPPSALPAPEEYASGATESNNIASPDPATDFVHFQPGATGVDVIFNSPAPGDPLPVGDDGSFELALPFPFTICGQSFQSVFVNANGSVTFGAPSADFSESAAEFRSGPPRVAGVWDDLNASAGGIVTFAQTKNSFSAIWDGVPEFPATGSNSFSITLKRSASHVDVALGAVSALDGLTGVSCGGAVTSGLEAASDLSSFGGDRIDLHDQPALFELFTTGSPNDLAGGTVRFTGSTDYEDNWAEPNDNLVHARQIELPFASLDVDRFTEIEPTGADVDFYRFSAEAGTSLVAQVVAGQLDTLIVVADAAGNVLAVDDDGGPGLLSRAVVPIPADGDYFLGVTTFPDTDFTGDGGSGGRYVLDLFTVDGTLLTLGDDTSVEVPLPFSFPFQGAGRTSVFVNSNGNLTFGSGDTDFSESVAEFLNDQPRIAALWDDLSPNNAGLVVVEQTASTWSVTFDGVPEFVTTGANTFTVTLHASGRIDVAYGAITAADALVGVTPGGGAANPGESDLSSSPTWPAAGVTFEQFVIGGPVDLGGSTISFVP